jgi:HK97 family phage major capsid protein
VRGGDSANLRALEQKALSGSLNPDGGFLVPPEIETIIGERLFNISPIRSLPVSAPSAAISTKSR